jgi:hypothetical protein
MKKNTKPKDNNIISNNLKKLSKKITNNKRKYESINIVSETGDSIYYTEPIEELTQGGQAYISFYKVRKIVNKELQNRLGPSINNKNEQ